MPYNTPAQPLYTLLICAPLSPNPSSLVRSYRRAPADNLPAPLPIKSAVRTRIGWISTDFPVRARHLCNPCSTAASPVAEAPESRDVIQPEITQTKNLRSSIPKPCGFSDRNLTVLDSQTICMPSVHTWTRPKEARLWALLSAVLFYGNL